MVIYYVVTPTTLSFFGTEIHNPSFSQVQTHTQRYTWTYMNYIHRLMLMLIYEE